MTGLAVDVIDGEAGLFCYPFPMVSATATMLVIRPNPIDLRMSSFLAARRAQHVKVYPGMLSLPGGFMNAKVKGQEHKHPGERIEKTALRELEEEAQIKALEDDLNVYHVSSNPDTDPRAHVVNVCYWLEVNEDQVSNAVPGDDIDAIDWLHIGTVMNDIDMAFDHLNLARRGVRHWARLNGVNL